MKAVYSHWNLERSANGYNSFKDFLMCMSLSVLVTKRHFQRVELVTNDLYKKILFEDIQLPFTDVNTYLNKFDNLPKIWWGYAKLNAYAIQKEPFFHIDNDVFLWDGIKQEILASKMFFQSVESPFSGGYGWYPRLLEVANRAPVFPKIIKDNPVDYAYNCGVMGCNDLSLIEEWLELSTQYVMSEKNAAFFKNPDNLLIHQNLLHEQYFISSITKRRGLLPHKDIRCILSTENIVSDCYRKGNRYTHLWGLDKKKVANMDKVYYRLKSDYPDYYNRIIGYCKINNV